MNKQINKVWVQLSDKQTSSCLSWMERWKERERREKQERERRGRREREREVRIFFEWVSFFSWEFILMYAICICI